MKRMKMLVLNILAYLLHKLDVKSFCTSCDKRMNSRIQFDYFHLQQCQLCNKCYEASTESCGDISEEDWMNFRWIENEEKTYWR